MTHFLNVVGLVGFSLLSGGVYLKFGLAVTLMVTGALLLIYALKALGARGGTDAELNV